MMGHGLTRRQLLAISAGTLATWLAELPSRLQAKGLTPFNAGPGFPNLEASSAASTQTQHHSHKALMFQDVTHHVLRQRPEAAGWPYICVLDVDNDGWPDLLLGHQGDFDQPVGSIDAPITGPYPYGAQVFKNNRNGTFTEITSRVLPRPVRNRIESYWVFIAGDMDGDGVIEVFAGTDQNIPNLIFKTNTTPWTDVAPAWGMTDPESLPSSASFIPGQLVGGDPNTLALVFSNFVPVQAAGNIPEFYFWVRQGGVWRRTTVGLSGNGVDPWWQCWDGGIRPYAMQFAAFPEDPTGATVTGIVTAINQQMWQHYLPNNPVLFSDQNNDPTQWAQLSAYSHDSELVDVNNDGKIDFVTADYIDDQTVAGLRVVLGTGSSIPAPEENGPHGGAQPYPYTSWFIYGLPEPSSLAVGDFDNDGLVDVFLLCGAYGGGQGEATRRGDFLGHNNGDGTFTNVISGSGLQQYDDTTYEGSGCVVIDYDLDGKLDLIVGYNGLYNYTNADGVYFEGTQGPYTVYRNTTPNPGHFIGFALPVNADIGSTITISGKRFGPRRIQLTARTGWMRQSERLVHFGLGAFHGPVDVQITRPDGSRRTFTRLLINHYWRITGGRLVLLK